MIAFDVNGEIECFEARCLTRPLEIPFETHQEVEREARFLGTPENVAGGQQGNLPRLLTGNVCVKQEVSDSIHKSFKVQLLSTSETQTAICKLPLLSECLSEFSEFLWYGTCIITFVNEVLQSFSSS